MFGIRCILIGRYKCLYLICFNLYFNSYDVIKGSCVGLWSSSAFLAPSSKVVMFGLLLIFFGIKGNMILNNSKDFANDFALFQSLMTTNEIISGSKFIRCIYV